MPLEGLDEEGLPKNPDLKLVQWKFLLSVEAAGGGGEQLWGDLVAAIKENGECELRPHNTGDGTTLPPPPCSYGAILLVGVCRAGSSSGRHLSL